MHRKISLAAALALFCIAATGTAQAETYPSRPIRVIVPLSAGSAADIVPRIVFEQVSKQIGQPIVVENRAGASGTIGARAVASAEPDGYTLLASSSALVISPSTVPNVPYDPVKDFEPIAALGNLPNVLVVAPNAPFKNIQEFVETGKKRTITYGSIGVGSPIQLALERLRLSAGFKAQAVFFRGAPEALLDTMAGRIDCYYAPLLPALPQIKQGKLRALVVSSPERAATLPDVPTSEEAGYKNSSYRFWIGLFAPAKTPAAVVARLSEEVEKALKDPGVQEKLSKLGVQPMHIGHKGFVEFVKDDYAKTTELTTAAGIAVKK
jgi:tripartite-type tricarboxylate transporter receptor subunit TctC